MREHHFVLHTNGQLKSDTWPLDLHHVSCAPTKASNKQTKDISFSGWSDGRRTPRLPSCISMSEKSKDLLVCTPQSALRCSPCTSHPVEPCHGAMLPRTASVTPTAAFTSFHPHPFDQHFTSYHCHVYCLCACLHLLTCFTERFVWSRAAGVWIKSAQFVLGFFFSVYKRLTC